MFHKYYVTYASDSKEAVGDVISRIKEPRVSVVVHEMRTNINGDTPNQGRSFSDALCALKNGKGARLPKWSPDVVIRAQFPDEHSKMTAPYLCVESRFGRVPWKETFIELFSEEWEIVD